MNDAVCTITLARAEKANALSAEMALGVLAAVEAAPAKGARIIILRADGKHFSAGFDFGDFEALTDGDLVLRFLEVEAMLQAVHYCPIPVLALVQGRAVGAGADLASAAMRVIATPETSFFMPGPRFGVILGTRRLAGRIGAGLARAIQTESRPIKAAEAAEIGLIDGILAAEDWSAEISAFSKKMQTLDTETVAALAAATSTDTRDADMAALARSVMRPGIKQRIADFRKGA
jgi:enoyl-CoA hydratase/carnithine racemase